MACKYTFKIFLSLFALILLGISYPAFAQGPNITYANYLNFVKNAPASASPANTGGAVPATVYGTVTTIAGAGFPGYANGTGTAAQFNIPEAVTKDAAGNLYIADETNNAIRKIATNGAVTTFAGSAAGAAGYAEGTGGAALFNSPDGIAIDAAGNLFVSDYYNDAIRKITPGGLVTTFAPNIIGPSGLCFDQSGNLLVAEQGSNLVIKITPAGVVSTVAGSANVYGYVNSTTPTLAEFSNESDIQVDPAGNIFVADYQNNAVRKIATNGTVTTFAGSDVYENQGGFADGVGTAAVFNNLTGIAIGSGNVLYVADLLNNAIRRILPDGTVTTVAGGLPPTKTQGAADGVGPAASFFNPVDLYVDNTGAGYIADASNGDIRKIILTGYTIDKPLPPGLTFDVTTGKITGTPTTISPPAPYTITAYNGSGFSQFTTIITVRNPPIAPPVARPKFSYNIPPTLAINVSVRYDPITTGGLVPRNQFGSVRTIAGSNTIGGNIDAIGANARFGNLWGIDIDAAGNLYVADNTQVRKIDTTTLAVTTLAGGAAGFNNLAGVAVSPSDSVVVGDLNNHAIRRISTPGGAVTTFANNINLLDPVGVTVDEFGYVYVADQANNVIRQIKAAGSMGSIYSGSLASSGLGNGNIATATFKSPSDLKFDQSGNLFIADEGNDVIREISNTGVVSTTAGTSSPGFLNGPYMLAEFNNPTGLALDLVNDIYIVDANNLAVRMLNEENQVVTVAGSLLRRLSADGVGAEATFQKATSVVYSKGNLYVTDLTCVRKIVVTGYTIDKPLPNGLSFNEQTGEINGAPTMPSSPTAYTITGYNEGGNYSFTDTIAVIAQAPVISYAPQSQIDTVGVLIKNPLTPTSSGGAVIKYTVSPALPPGMVIDTLTGIISGTPTVAKPAADYTVTATNSGGTGTFIVNITVVPVVLTPQTVTFNTLPVKTYGDPDFDPGATSSNSTLPVTYTSDNTSVATIVNGQVHITGAGTATITASQSGNAHYSDATPVQEVLTVNKAPLIIKADDKTRVVGAPNPVFTATYTGFVYGETPAQLTAQPAITTIADVTSAAGQYPITVSAAISSNYTFTYVSGILTVTAEQPVVVIPNAFTPNGDGYNDLWNIKSLESYPQCMVSVYTRYGSLVYQSRGYARAWDGTYNGSQLPTGTYYYIINLQNGTPQLSGYVALIR